MSLGEAEPLAQWLDNVITLLIKKENCYAVKAKRTGRRTFCKDGV